MSVRKPTTHTEHSLTAHTQYQHFGRNGRLRRRTRNTPYKKIKKKITHSWYSNQSYYNTMNAERERRQGNALRNNNTSSYRSYKNTRKKTRQAQHAQKN